MSFCVNNQARAWVWANQPTASSYIPAASYQHSSEGGTVTVIRTLLGEYAVTFPSIGAIPSPEDGGTVHVAAYGGAHRCNVASWSGFGGSDANVVVKVRCFGAGSAQPADGRFTALYYRDGPHRGRNAAYAWIGAYAPTPLNPYYSWNARNGPITAQATNAEARVTFSSFAHERSINLVTAYSGGAGWCGPTQGHNEGTMDVFCVDGSGALRPATSGPRFTVSSVADGWLGANQPHVSGGVSVDPEIGSTCGGMDFGVVRASFNTSGGVNGACLDPSANLWRITFPGLTTFSKSTALVTGTIDPALPIGQFGKSCSIMGWGNVSGSVEVRVRCFDAGGAISNNVKFGLVYLTDISA